MKAGATFPALFAMIARRHMHQYGTTPRAAGRGGGEEPRQRREEPVRAHAQGDHAGAGAGRQADRRSADGLRLLAGQRRRGGGADLRRSSAPREFTDKPVRGARHRADLGPRGARPEGRHHHVPGGAQGRRKGVQDGRRRPRRTSSSPKCTTASPSPRSSRSRISASSKPGEGGPYAAEGCTARRRAEAGQHQRRTEGQGPPGGRDRRGADLRRGRCRSAARRASCRWRGTTLGLAQNLGGSGATGRGHDPGGSMRSGTVYTETVVYSAPEAFVNDAPYQIAIVDAGRRRTGDRPHPRRARRNRRRVD